MVSAPERTDALANRQRILAAARDVIAERGAAAEIKEVAERAGVGIGTIYRNFATKDDLVLGIMEELLARLQAVRDEALEIDEPEAAIRHFVSGMYEVLERWSPAAVAMIAGAHSDRIKTQFTEFVRNRKIEAIFHRGIALGLFRKDMPVELVRGMLLNTCNPIAYLAVQDVAGREELADGFADLILRAIRA